MALKVFSLDHNLLVLVCRETTLYIVLITPITYVDSLRGDCIYGVAVLIDGWFIQKLRFYGQGKITTVKHGLASMGSLLQRVLVLATELAHQSVKELGSCLCS